jgi:nitroreductase
MGTPFDLPEADRLLATTRAVRKRLDPERPVARETLLECVSLSQQAPTGSNSQSWRWVLVDDADTRKALAGLYKKAADAYLEAARANLGSSDAQTARVYDSAFWLVDHLAEVPVHVIPCMIGRLPEKAGNMAAASLYGSIFPAVWSFQLALRARGLGSVLTTLHLVHEREAAELLGIDHERVSQVGLLPVAYTRGTEFKRARRPPAESIVHWNRWASEEA